MFGLFDPPRLKAQRRAAGAARSVREFAGREVSLEVRMLVDRLRWAGIQRDTAFGQGRSEMAGAITLALVDGQELMDRIGYSIDPILHETQEKWRTADSADQFEALTTYEQDLCDLLIELRDQVRLHLGAIGIAAMAVGPAAN